MDSSKNLSSSNKDTISRQNAPEQSSSNMYEEQSENRDESIID